MSTDVLARKCRDRLMASELRTVKTKRSSGRIWGLRCPECGHSEAYAHDERPWVIMCSRLNKCGCKISIFDIFPDLKPNFETDFKPTKEDPHRPAREYLQQRGIRKALSGLRFEYWPNLRKTGRGGVMFWIARIGKKDVWNGRFFDPPAGDGKTHNVGATAGLYWSHPEVKYDRSKPLYICEGVIDALSLIEMGFQSVAVLSAGQDPTKIDLDGLYGDQK